VNYLIKLGLVDKDTDVLSYVTKKDVAGKHVIGKLPYHMACHTKRYTEIQLRTPEELKGRELTMKEVEFYSVGFKTYEIKEVDYE
jgi:hypothetical protein